MADQHLRVLLEDRRDGEEGRPLAHVGEGLEAVRHHHVDPAGEQELAAVEAGAALAQVALDAGLAVEPGGDRLVVAAMLGLRAPVGHEAHLVERLRSRSSADRHEHWPGECHARGGTKESATIETIRCAGHGSGLHGYAAIVEGPRQIFPDRNARAGQRRRPPASQFPPQRCRRQYLPVRRECLRRQAGLARQTKRPRHVIARGDQGDASRADQGAGLLHVLDRVQ